MSQTKIVEKIVRFELFLTVNYVKVTYRKTFQNKIFPELNSKKHTPTNRLIFTKLRNCAKLSQTRNWAILREMTFANYCANCCFFAQNWCAKKEKNCVSFRKNCAKVLRMEPLVEDQLSWWENEEILPTPHYAVIRTIWVMRSNQSKERNLR